MAGLGLSILLSSLGTSSVNIALPTLASTFGGTLAGVQWVVLAYLVGITTLVLSAGRLGDQLGRRRVLLTGIALFSAGALAASLAPTLPMLIVARGLQGVGAAAMLSLTMALVSIIAPATRAGSALGLLGTLSAVGTALGPTLGGFLIGMAGWRAVFWLNVPLGLAAGLLTWLYVPVDVRAAQPAVQRFDLRGTVLLALALAVYTLGLTIGRDRFGWLNWVLLGAAPVFTVLFVITQGRTAHPLVQLTGWRNSVVANGLMLSWLVSTVLMATLVVGPFYLRQALGLEPGLTGLLLACGPAVVALIGVPAGQWVDRGRVELVTLVGLAGIASGAGMLALLPMSLGLTGYLTALVVLTVGYGLFQTANNAAVLRAQPAQDQGATSGMLNLSRNLGLITGTAALGLVFRLAVGTSQISAAAPAAIARGLHATFAVAAVLMVAAMVLMGSSLRRHAPLVEGPVAPPV